jgi:hypothetical protein
VVRLVGASTWPLTPPPPHSLLRLKPQSYTSSSHIPSCHDTELGTRTSTAHIFHTEFVQAGMSTIYCYIKFHLYSFNNLLFIFITVSLNMYFARPPSCYLILYENITITEVIILAGFFFNNSSDNLIPDSAEAKRQAGQEGSTARSSNRFLSVSKTLS